MLYMHSDLNMLAGTTCYTFNKALVVTLLYKYQNFILKLCEFSVNGGKCRTALFCEDYQCSSIPYRTIVTAFKHVPLCHTFRVGSQ